MGIDLQAADVIVPVITAVLTLVGVLVTNNSRDRVNEARSEGVKINGSLDYTTSSYGSSSPKEMHFEPPYIACIAWYRTA